MNSKILYKYRDFRKPQRIDDIFINKVIHASHYQRLNDPMEGFYNLKEPNTSRNVIKKIYDKKQCLLIGSFSAKNYDKLMWSHYSNGSRGIVLGVKLNENKNYKPIKIIYDGLNTFSFNDTIENCTMEILSHKHDVWNYEDEYRVFTDEKNIEIDIVEVFLGVNISTQNKQRVINHCVNNRNIRLYQQQKDYSFIPEYEY